MFVLYKLPRRHTTLIQRCIDVDIWWRRRTTYFQRRYNVVNFDVEFRPCLNVESTSGLIFKKSELTNFVLNVQT